MSTTLKYTLNFFSLRKSGFNFVALLALAFLGSSFHLDSGFPPEAQDALRRGRKQTEGRGKADTSPLWREAQGSALPSQPQHSFC